jgi:hypothetical protein
MLPQKIFCLLGIGGGVLEKFEKLDENKIEGVLEVDCALAS